MSHSERPYLIGLLVVLFWGANGAIVRWLGAVVDIHYTTLVLVSIIVSLFFVSFYLPRGRQDFWMHTKAMTRKQWLLLFLVGLTWNAYLLTMYFGLAEASNGSLIILINYLWPLIFIVLHHAYHKARFQTYQVVGMMIVASGLLLALHQGTDWAISKLHIAVALLSATLGGLYTILYVNTKSSPLTAPETLWWFQWLSLPFVAALWWFSGGSFSAHGWAYLGLLVTGFNTGALQPVWNRALRHPKGTYVSLLSYLSPLLSIVLIIFLLGGVFYWQLAVGTICVIGGNIFIRWRDTLATKKSVQ